MTKDYGGNGGLDIVSKEELERLGSDKCMEYCKTGCWYSKWGCSIYCENCALWDEFIAIAKRKELKHEKRRNHCQSKEK